MKQPEFPDIGNKMDVANHRLQVAKEEVERNSAKRNKSQSEDGAIMFSLVTKSPHSCIMRKVSDKQYLK